MPDHDLARLLAARPRLQEQLPEFIRGRRWFGGKARAITGAEIVDTIAFDAALRAYFFLIRIGYADGPNETYTLPLVTAEHPADIPGSAPHLRVATPGDELVLYDAVSNASFLESLLKAIRDQRGFQGEHGQVFAAHTPALPGLAASGSPLPPRLMRAEQSNSSVAYGDRLILKLFRRLEAGTNPDLEIGRFLTEKTAFRNVPPLAGYLEYGDGGQRMSMGILQGFVPNRGDAWEFTLQTVQQYYRRVLAGAVAPPPLPQSTLPQLAQGETPQEAEQLIGDYLDSARLLGRRTAELHLALAGSSGDPAFDPEPFTPADQKALCAGALQLAQASFRLLRQQLGGLSPSIQKEARRALDLQAKLESRLRSVETQHLTALRTRIHGDYHLGQVLVSGEDFFIIDFEGEPARPLADRRRKRSPLQDVAGMLRSFHYAAYAPLLGADASATTPVERVEPWAYFWQRWVSAAFVRSYLQTSGAAGYVPRSSQELTALLDLYLIEKAVYELGYELNNRPSWVRIPLDGILQHVAGARKSF